MEAVSVQGAGPGNEERWRRLTDKGIWAAVGGICLLAAVLFAVGVPMFYMELRDHCVDAMCEAFYNEPPGTEWLAARGLTPGHYAFAYTSIYVVFGLACLFPALWMYWKKGAEPMALLGAATLAVHGITFTPVLGAVRESHIYAELLVRFLGAAGYIAFILFFSLFPNGRFVSRSAVWLAVVVLGMRVPGLLFPGTAVDLQELPKVLMGVWLLLWTVGLFWSQIYRYRRQLGPIEKQQAKWVVYGLGLAFGGLIGFTAVYLLQKERFDANPYLMYALEVAIHGSMLILSAALLMALLRRRLWEIDPLVNRTLLYGLLSISVVAVYVAVVWYIGTIFEVQGSLLVSLAATGLVAVMFAPLKEWLQRGVNRLLYGEKDEPYSVLARLGKRLEEPLPPDAVLLVVARTVKEALRLPYAGITLRQNGGNIPVARVGVPGGETISYALVHRGETLGHLHVDPRSPGEGFTPSDEAFLGELARQAAAVVLSVKVSMELKLLSDDLQLSREKLVLAREEERRRLRMNLHDDTAPRLAALALTASAAEELVDRDAQAAKEILAELRGVIRTTVAEIRGLVDDLRPPALDQLGLVGAVRERMAALRPRFDGQGGSVPLFELEAPEGLPVLPAAIEVAAYRILTEAMVNAVRHADAGACRVRIAYMSGGLVGDRLELEVRDDGKGLPVPEVGHHSHRKDEIPRSVRMEGPSGETRELEGRRGGEAACAVQHRPEAPQRGGHGLQTMRERAAELGGSCRIERMDGGGTRLLAVLPIPAGREETSA